MRAGVDVLVATPGRLLDHLSAPYATLKNIEFLVLDEADRMLDMGFLPDIKRILRLIPVKRQTLLFSATMPPPIAALTREMLHNPLMIDLGRRPVPAGGTAKPCIVFAAALLAIATGADPDQIVRANGLLRDGHVPGPVDVVATFDQAFSFPVVGN